MAKKKRKQVKPWCWYCEREFDSDMSLIQHQRLKHFRCPDCHKSLNTAPGMTLHYTQVHKRTLSKVPNALPKRDTFEHEIFGMEGVPPADLAAHEIAVLGPEAAAKRAKSESHAAPTVPPFPFPGFPMGVPPGYPPSFAPHFPPPGMPPGAAPMWPPPYPGMATPIYSPGMPPYGYSAPSTAQPASITTSAVTTVAEPTTSITSATPQAPPSTIPASAPATAAAAPPPTGPVSTSGLAVTAPIISSAAAVAPTAVLPVGVKRSDKNMRLVYDEHTYSVEEKRAQLSKYAFTAPHVKAQAQKLDSAIESRLANLKGTIF
ncbi:hypothetical protein IWQ60_009079 [Tieghemiomyces parasiticus]|uniref:BED-type domain-containing protein n=1 Tax=Tieghemiomyces parasiticus TaxID=78921 RepID=A0A9W7ZQF4_9FUNG|nr:hypothetical protein IWQ60_009079 [Tieghemiomyces parasiticus]